MDKPTSKKAQQADDNQRTWDDTEESEAEEGRLVIDTVNGELDMAKENEQLKSGQPNENDGSDKPRENKPDQPEERDPTSQLVEADTKKLSQKLKTTQLEDGELEEEIESPSS